MDEDQVKHLNKLRVVHEKRLRILKLQAANFGALAPPHILMEIEDIQRELSLIDSQIPNSTLSPDEDVSARKMVVLFLSASPIHLAHLQLAKEVREIREKLQLAKKRENFVLECREAARPGDITQAIFDLNPQIIHFSGHGTESGALCFEDEIGKVQLIEANALAELFNLVAEQVKCVILNACYSAHQAKAIAQHIPYVIGMNQAVGDKAAIVFSVGFYKALGANCSIEQAYKFGCVEIQLQGVPEHLTPVLIQQAKIP